MNTTPEPATFVLVPEEAPEAYYEGYATPCGGDTIDGKRYRIVATKRLGERGRSDAQYIIDRLASGLHFAKIQEPKVDRVALADKILSSLQTAAATYAELNQDTEGDPSLTEVMTELGDVIDASIQWSIDLLEEL